MSINNVKKIAAKACVAALAVGMTTSAYGLNIGYHVDGLPASSVPEAPGNDALRNMFDGHTATRIGSTGPGIAGIDFTQFDAVVLFNPFGSSLVDTGARAADLAAYVDQGGILAYFDGDATTAADLLPGAGGLISALQGEDDISLAPAVPDSKVVDGPAGMITEDNLDGANFSANGHVLVSSLPAGATPILGNGTMGETTLFKYAYDNGGVGGAVYSSTINLAFLLEEVLNGAPGVESDARAAFVDIFARNVVADIDMMHMMMTVTTGVSSGTQTGVQTGTQTAVQTGTQTAVQTGIQGGGNAVPEPVTSTLGLAGLAVLTSSLKRRRTA